MMSNSGDTEDNTPAPRLAWLQKWVPNLAWLRRAIVAVMGFTVLLIGVAMIVLPGPAFIVIPLGLAILATEFVWAAKLLKKAKAIFARKAACATCGKAIGKARLTADPSAAVCAACENKEREAKSPSVQEISE